MITKFPFSLLVVLCAFIAVSSGAPTTDQSASVAYLGAQPTKIGKGTVYHFRVTNTSRKNLFYSGYDSANPLYKRQTQRWFHWHDFGDNWRGGSSFYRMAPGGSFVFESYGADWFWPWRVGICLSPRPSHEVAESKGVTVWSPTVR